MSEGRTQASGRPESGLLLEVEDLRTYFRTPRGKVKAVDGVSFTLDRGKALGIVGESGSGKTVLSRSIMGLLGGKSVERTGSIRFAGQEMIHLTAQADAPHLGPRDVDDLPGPDDVAEPADEDRQADRRAAAHASRRQPRATPGRRPSACCAKSASPRRRGASSSTRTSCRAACASG